MKNLLTLLFACILSAGCMTMYAQPADCLKKINWLNGTWKMEDKGSVLIEEWITDEKGVMKCRSFEVTAGDTNLIENSTLSCVAGKTVFTYHPILKDENDKREPVSFVLVSDDKDVFIFENKAHDFPKRVVYQKVNDKECHAWIEGEENGKLTKIDFFYKRIQ